MPEKTHRLCGKINVSLQSYMREQIEHAASGTAASAGAKHLKRIAEQTAQLIEALGACDDYSPIGAVAVGCLAREANMCGERIGGYPGLPPREFVVADTDPMVRRVDYRGQEKVGEIIGELSLLRDLAEAAHPYECTKVEKGKTDTARHPENLAMSTLFCELHQAWQATFGDVPKTSVSSGGGKAGGPYVRFVSTLLATYREKIPAEIDTYAPGLRDSLELTSDAIRYRTYQARDLMAKSSHS